MEGAELRAAREAAGFSLQEVSAHTRIPVKHLEALENGELHKLPAGPYRNGYARQYRLFLGMPRQVGPVTPNPIPAARPVAPRARRPEPEEEEEIPFYQRPLSKGARQALRGVALGALVVVTLVLVVKVVEEAAGPSEQVIGEAPDQVVEVRPTERVRLQVVADDRLLFDGTVEPGPGGTSADGRSMTCKGGCTFSAHDQLEIAVSNLSLVNLSYNGRNLKPLGAQSRSRRLVFVDDVSEP